MEGCTKKAGGVCLLRHVKNPILLACDVMRKTPHSLIAFPNAEELALEWGHTLMEMDYFKTDLRKRQFEAFQRNVKGGSSSQPMLDHNIVPEPPLGTVGCVVLDQKGNLAAGSSTGGMTGKYVGRVADSSIAGAGFYADANVAVSGTGVGDEFIRRQTCFRVAALMEYSKISLDEAAKEVIQKDMELVNAGLIAVDRNGNYAMPFNTVGMFRAVAGKSIDTSVHIY